MCVVQVCALNKTSKVGLKPTNLLHVNNPSQTQGGGVRTTWVYKPKHEDIP